MPSNLAADTRRMREIKSKGFPWYVVESLLFENGYQAVLLHRLAHWFRRRGIPVLGPLVHRLSLLLTGVDIAPGAVIGPGLRISHGVGIVIGAGVTVGRDALLMQGVTLGAPTQARIAEMPTLGDRVILGAGAAVIGAVSVGDDVLVGIGCVVTQDVPSGAKILPPEPRTVLRREAVPSPSSAASG